MTDKLGWISHVLDREEEFQEAMRTEVGITSSCANNLGEMELLRVFTGTGIFAQ